MNPLKSLPAPVPSTTTPMEKSKEETSYSAQPVFKKILEPWNMAGQLIDASVSGPNGTYNVTLNPSSSPSEGPLYAITAASPVNIPAHSTRTLNTGITFRLPANIVGHISAPSDFGSDLKVWGTTISHLSGPIQVRVSNFSAFARAVAPGDLLAHILFSSALHVKVVGESTLDSPLTLNDRFRELNFTTPSSNNHITNGNHREATSSASRSSRSSRDSGYGGGKLRGYQRSGKRTLTLKPGTTGCTRCTPWRDELTGQMVCRAFGPHELGCPLRRTTDAIRHRNAVLVLPSQERSYESDDSLPIWRPRRPRTPYHQGKRSPSMDSISSNESA